MGGLRIAQFTLQSSGPQDSGRRSQPHDDDIISQALPDGWPRACMDAQCQARYENSPLSPNYRQPTSVARVALPHSDNLDRPSAFSSIFPARAELFAVRSFLAQPDLSLVHCHGCLLEARTGG